MRFTAISEKLGRGAALGVVDHHLDLGRRRWPTPLPPAEITSCIEAPRIAPGLCSPSAQSTASVMFDLPRAVGADDHADARRELEPGPLGERLESLHLDRSQIHARPPLCTGSPKARGWVGRDQRPPQSPSRSSACSAATCSAAFLLRPDSLADPLGVDDGRDLEGARVRRARIRRSPRSLRVARRRASSSCSADLKSIRCSDRVLDPRLEGGGDRVGDPLEAEGEEAGADQRLGRPPAAAARRRAGPRPGSPSSSSSGSASRSISGTPSSRADLGAGDAADRLVVDLGQPPDVGAGEAREEVARRRRAPSTLSPRKARRS